MTDKDFSGIEWVINHKAYVQSFNNLCGLSIANHLTLSWRRPLSYRNQSIDFLRESMDWFLYDNGLRHERVKQFEYNKDTSEYHNHLSTS